jgi:hypothetical protein
MNVSTSQESTQSSVAQYRPRATRYEAGRNEACLAWQEQGSQPTPESADLETRRHFALLIDISQTGASIALDRIPHPADGVKLRLDGNQVEDWTEAEVVGVTTTPQGPHLVRLAFRNPCPFETLLAAICG